MERTLSTTNLSICRKKANNTVLIRVFRAFISGSSEIHFVPLVLHFANPEKLRLTLPIPFWSTLLISLKLFDFSLCPEMLAILRILVFVWGFSCCAGYLTIKPIVSNCQCLPTAYIKSGKLEQRILRSGLTSKLARFSSLQSNDISPPTQTSQSSKSIVSTFYRGSWFSWWVQIILSVVSGITLTFAKQQAQRGFSLWSSGFAFSALGVLTAYINAFWTWNITRLCVRINSGKVEPDKVKVSLRKYAKISVGISLVGMFFSLLGAEQIVGTLASKILSAQSVSGFIPINPAAVSNLASNTFQPLDIFLVQANTNILVSHFAPLLCFILLQLQV